jgi:Na+/H+-dicarboxylate symporter
MVLGIVLGVVAVRITGGDKIVNDWIRPWGALFIRLLQLIAVPLVFVSLVIGVVGLKDIKRFSKLGGRTIGIYMLTTVMAVSLGIGLGLVVKPGQMVDQSRAEQIQAEFNSAISGKKDAAVAAQGDGPLGFLNEVVGNNIIASAGNNSKMLHVICFATFFAFALLLISKESSKPVIDLLKGVNEAILKMVDYIIKAAPYGTACLMAGMIVSHGGDMSIFGALGIHVLTVVGAMFFLMYVLYPLMIFFFSRKVKMKTFLKSMYPVQMFAFTTSSSSVTLPVTMDTVNNKLGVSKDVSSFVLPIGMTINMDGTALYQGVCALFVAQAFGIDLSLNAQISIIVTATLASIGTAGVPGAGLIMLTLVLTSIGLPIEGIGLVAGIDAILDAARTCVNVTGDTAVCAIVAATEGEILSSNDGR